jgi:hypothetical protein
MSDMPKTSHQCAEQEHYREECNKLRRLLYQLEASNDDLAARLDEACDIADANIFAPTWNQLNQLPATVESWSRVVTVDTGKPYRDKARVAELRNGTVARPDGEPFIEYQLRNECRVCGARPDNEGERVHGKGCYAISENGGGSDWPE